MKKIEAYENALKKLDEMYIKTKNDFHSVIDKLNVQTSSFLIKLTTHNSHYREIPKKYLKIDKGLYDFLVEIEKLDELIDGLQQFRRKLNEDN